MGNNGESRVTDAIEITTAMLMTTGTARVARGTLPADGTTFCFDDRRGGLINAEYMGGNVLMLYNVGSVRAVMSDEGVSFFVPWAPQKG